ncbi:MAG: type VI secretion system baseplate subunit TssG [Proteobacteria bacterium]|nr:type VI secretion system baseplate subunit TssG [Pseudomonadota bacterium]
MNALNQENANLPGNKNLRKISEEFYKYSFTQLIQQIEKQFPRCTPLGEGTDPDKEVLKGTSNYDFSFSTGDVDHCEFNVINGKTEVRLNFFRLGGADGPLPVPYVQNLLKRKINDRDSGAIDFLNQFTHRQISILYRALKLMEAGKHGSDIEEELYVRMILSWVGFGQQQAKGRTTISPRVILGYGNFFAQKRRSIEGLEQIITHFFKVETHIDPFMGDYYAIPERLRTELGEKNSRLGRGLPLGKRSWVQEAKIAINLGPLNYEQYCQFLPDNDGYYALKDLIRNYYNPALDYDLKLHISGEEIPATALSQFSEKPESEENIPKPGLRLGWNTWLKDKKPKQNKNRYIRHISGNWIRKNGEIIKQKTLEP